MKKIELLKEITKKHEAHDPLTIKRLVDKVNEIITELIKSAKADK